MNVIEKKFAADQFEAIKQKVRMNTPIPAALEHVAGIFGSSDREFVSFTHVAGETFKVWVLGFELKRNCTLVLSRNENLEHEMSGPVYEVKVVKRAFGFIPRRTLIESSVDMVPFCTVVPETDRLL